MTSRVLLVVIDAATPHVVCPAIQTGRLPTMQRLAEIGDKHQSSATIFPSITPAATSTIITGAYPAEHGIAGASWFDAAREEIAYYGDDFWIILQEGFGRFVNDFLLRLNGDRLRAPTLSGVNQHPVPGGRWSLTGRPGRNDGVRVKADSRSKDRPERQRGLAAMGVGPHGGAWGWGPMAARGGGVPRAIDK